MPTYVAFLRAVNLGARRRFPQADIRAATEAAGGTQVATHLNTGNVRLTSRKRSADAVAAALAAAYEEKAGFEVPTIVLTTTEVATIAARGRELRAEHAPVTNHYVSLYPGPPDPRAVAEVQGLSHPGERCLVTGRAAHVLLEGAIHESRLLRSRQFRALGEGTARTLNVLEAIAAAWC